MSALSLFGSLSLLATANAIPFDHSNFAIRAPASQDKTERDVTWAANPKAHKKRTKKCTPKSSKTGSVAANATVSAQGASSALAAVASVTSIASASSVTPSAGAASAVVSDAAAPSAASSESAAPSASVTAPRADSNLAKPQTQTGVSPKLPLLSSQSINQDPTAQLYPVGSAGLNPDSLPADDPLAKLMLARVNQWRDLFSQPPLVWDGALADVAIKNAKACSGQHSDFEKAAVPVYAENMMSLFRTNMPLFVQQTMDGWGLEVRDFNFATQEWNMMTGHFVNMVNGDYGTIGCGWHNDCGQGKNNIYCEFGYGATGGYGKGGKIPEVTGVNWDLYDITK